MPRTNRESPHITFAFLEDPTRGQIDQIVGLYRMAGWWEEGVDGPDSIARIIAGSHCFLVARIDDEVIGIGRAISDGVSDSYIQDITVKDSLRRRGIGGAIVKRLVSRLRKDGLHWIGLIAERGTDEFYEGIGFEKMPDSTPMIARET